MNSTINFIGRSIFNNSTATNSVGAVVLDSCMVNVIDTNTFISITAAEYGGVLSIANHSVLNIFGKAIFVSNSVMIMEGQ